MFFYQLEDIASFTLVIRPEISPRPSNLFTNDPASNDSKSSKCSPVPKKTIGDSVADTAESEPPPFA